MITFDKLEPQMKMFVKKGDELFPVLTKLTFWADSRYNTSNMPIEQLRVLEHDELIELVG